MASINKIIILGNLGEDPRINKTQSGNKIASMSVATSETWKDKLTGERKELTEWHRVVIYNQNLVDIAEKYLKKGSKVYLEGQIQTRKWEDRNGNERYSTEVVLTQFGGNIVLLDSKPEQSTSQNISHPTSQNKTSSKYDEFIDDNIPF